jgi:hypothetical protein
VTNVPAANYRLLVAEARATGAFKLGIGMRASPQVDQFTTTAASPLRSDVTASASSLGVDRKLINAHSNATVACDNSACCGRSAAPSPPGGDHKLSVTRSGNGGTYNRRMGAP